MTKQHSSHDFDIIVVGYGGAGAVAAIEAARSGASVLLVEKMPDPGGIAGALIGYPLADPYELGDLSRMSAIVSSGALRCGQCPTLWMISSVLRGRLKPVVNAVGESPLSAQVTRVAVRPGKGCKAVKGDKTKVTCTTTKAIGRVTVSLGDRNDTFTAKVGFALTVSGGTGRIAPADGSKVKPLKFRPARLKPPSASYMPDVEKSSNQPTRSGA